MREDIANIGLIMIGLALCVFAVTFIVWGLSALVLWVSQQHITYNAPYSGPVMSALIFVVWVLIGALLVVWGSVDEDEEVPA